MKKIFVNLIIGLMVPLFGLEKFEDKHLKCTLVKKEAEIISERQAESLEEFKVDVFLSKLKIEKGLNTFKFEKTEKGEDIYSQEVYSSPSGILHYKAIYTEYNKELHIFKENIDFVFDYDKEYVLVPGEDISKIKFEPIKKITISDGNKYNCIEATFFEKIKYKYDNY